MCERRRRRKNTGRHATRHAATTDDIARGKPFAVPPAGMAYHRRRWRGRPNNQRHAALDESSGPPRRRHAGTKLQTTSDRMHAATHALPASSTTTRVQTPNRTNARVDPRSAAGQQHNRHASKLQPTNRTNARLDPCAAGQLDQARVGRHKLRAHDAAARRERLRRRVRRVVVVARREPAAEDVDEPAHLAGPRFVDQSV